MYWQINFGKEQFSIITRDILISHEFAPFHGGVATYCREVAESAWQIGKPVEVWVPGRPVPGENDRIIRLGGKVSLRLGNLVQLTHQILMRRSAWDGQRIYLASLGSQWIFSHLWRIGLTGETQIIPLFHGSEILRYESNPWFRSFISDWFSSCSRVIAASAFTQKRLQSSSLMPTDITVELAPCGVRHDLVEQSKRRHSLTPDLDLASRPLKILTLARLHPRKGQADVIQALGELPPQLRQRIRYCLAGTGEEAYRKELQKLAGARQVNLELLGEIPDDQLGQIYADCDLYVMSSRSLSQSIEGFGMTYLEAGLFGKPVVGYRCGGVEGAVLNDQTGLLVHEGDIPALSRAIHQLLDDQTLRLKLGTAGKTHALSFSWERTAETLFLS